MDAIARVGRNISSEDFGKTAWDPSTYGRGETGPAPRVTGFSDLIDERLAILDYLGAMTPQQRAGVALLVLSNRLVREWAQWLKAVGFPAQRLDQYEGIPVSGIRRSAPTPDRNGLEFTRVILPGLNGGDVPAVEIDETDTYFMQARQLYVAMGRARDELWMSYAGQPSDLVEPLIGGDDIPVADFDPPEVGASSVSGKR